MKKVIIRVAGVLIVAGLAWYGYRFFKQLPQRQEHVPTAKAQKGDVVIRAYSRGELRAVRSATLSAPNLFGTVQVTRLAPIGALAKEKDLIAEFDDSERRAQLEETLLEVEQIDEQIKKAKADLAIRDNQDQVDLLRTRYSVRRAELDVKRNPIISEIDAKKNILSLEEQQRRLKQLESDIKSRREQAQAELAVLQENRNKSMIDVRREEQRIAQAKVLAPMTGLVAIRQNRSGFFMFGQQLPDIREGDTLQPGMPVADILDLSELEVVAKVGELDRANLHEGQDVLLTLDAVPDRKFKGKIKGMSGTASANVFSGDPAKKFDVIFSIDMRQLLTELGVPPQEVKKILDQAAQNAKKAPPAPPMAMAGGGNMVMGGPPGAVPAAGPAGASAGSAAGAAAAPGGAAGGAPGGNAQVRVMPGGAMMGAPGAPGMAGAGAGPGMAGGEGARGAGGGGMMRMSTNLSPEDQQKMRELFQKELHGKNPQDLTPEEKQKIFAKLRETMQAAAKQSKPGGAPPQGGEGPKQLPLAGGNPLDLMSMGGGSAGQYNEKDRENAKLPLAPEEDTALQVLLRPGLLADVEITVERIPDALHVPAQAIFEKDGKPIVYVQKGQRFEERPIQLARRSESMMVLTGGVKPGEVIAMADPYVRKGDKKNERGEKKAGAMGALPAGGK